MKHPRCTYSFWCAAVLSFLSATIASGQSSDIRGVVSDSLSGEKVPFASVVVVGISRGTSTNVSGFFLIAGLQPGSYEVSVSSVGYHRKVVRTAVWPGEATNLTVALSPEAVQVGEVVVTERAKRELKEIQTSVQVMDARDMKMVPVAGQGDIFRSIQALPGIVSTSDVSSQFYVRGGAGDQNLMLLDGMRIYNPYHALGIYSIFDADIVQTTEIFTGAFPPGFGGRLSSVVNLVTRDGRNTTPAAQASVNFLSSKVQIEGPVTEDLRLYANARRSLGTVGFNRFVHQDSPLSFYDVFVKATMAGTGGQSRYSTSAFLSGDEIAFPQPTEPDFHWTNKAIGFSGSGLIDDHIYVDAIAAGSEFRGERETKSSQYSTPASSIVRDFTIRTNLTIYTESRTLYFVGFEFNFPTLEYNLVNNSGNRLSINKTVPDIATWFRTQMTFGRWQFDGGVHIDLTSIFYSASSAWFQPRLNASLALFHDWRLKASFGRISQHIVTVNNEDDLITLFDAWIPIPDDLSAEQADHVVLGIGGSLIERIGLDVQAYSKKLRSLVVYNRDKLTSSDPDYVAGSGSSSGVEALLRYEDADLSMMGSYSLGWTNVTNGNLTYTPRYDRRHSLKLLGSVRATQAWDISTRWEFGTGLPFTPSVASYSRPGFNDYIRYPVPYDQGTPYISLGEKNSQRLPTFHRLDLSTSYRLQLDRFRVSVGGSIVNVYDRRNVFYIDRRTGRRVNSLSIFPSATLTVEYQ